MIDCVYLILFILLIPSKDSSLFILSSGSPSRKMLKTCWKASHGSDRVLQVFMV